MDRYYADMIEEFASDVCLSKGEQLWLDEIKKFSCNKWKDATVENNDQLMKEYIYASLIKKSKHLDEIGIGSLVDISSKINQYMGENCGVTSKFDVKGALKELSRVGRINRELDRYLNNPIISYEPMVIDINRYKMREIKNQFKGKMCNTEKGYFIVMDIFANNSLILKKMYTGRFVKLVLDKDLIGQIKAMDIVYLHIRQKYTLDWEIEAVEGYYPKEASEYIGLV